MAFAAFGGNAPANQGDSAKKSNKAIVWALLAPGLIYLGLFFFTPLISLIATSLEAPDASGAIGAYQYAFNVDNYAYVVTTYLPQIGRSFYYATVATILALLISFPLAYFIGVRLRSNPMVQRLLVTLVIAPFFISFLLRTIAWTQIFSDGCWIMSTLHSTGILASGLDELMRHVPRLYASPASIFRRITLPISMPGIISGTLLTFIPIAGDYVNASRDFLGSSKTSMIGTMVEADFLQNWDYPSASALSVLLMAVIVALVSVYVRKAGTEDLL